MLFSQDRVGRDGRRFRLFKFRTLPREAAAHGDYAWSVEPSHSGFAFLRESGLDELPQLWNVLRGDMSLVGPRPERPFHADRFSREVPDYDLRHLLRPGITGWAQVHGLRGDTSITKRVEYDLYYLRNWSLPLDLRALALTALGLARTTFAFLRASRLNTRWRTRSTSSTT